MKNPQKLKGINSKKTVNAVSSFLFTCLSGSKNGSFAVVEHGESDSHYCQFLVEGDGDGHPNGQLQIQVVGIENSGAKKLVDIKRFNALLKAGWSLDGYGNAECSVELFQSQQEDVSKIVENTMERLALVYQLNLDADWNVMLER